MNRKPYLTPAPPGWREYVCYCRFCAQQIPPDATRCPECGEDLEVEVKTR